LLRPQSPDIRRQQRARSGPAIEIENENETGSDWITDRIVVITQLAEELD
jgi:hypothetical protein